MPSKATKKHNTTHIVQQLEGSIRFRSRGLAEKATPNCLLAPEMVQPQKVAKSLKWTIFRPERQVPGESVPLMVNTHYLITKAQERAKKKNKKHSWLFCLFVFSPTYFPDLGFHRKHPHQPHGLHHQPGFSFFPGLEARQAASGDAAIDSHPPKPPESRKAKGATYGLSFQRNSLLERIGQVLKLSACHWNTRMVFPKSGASPKRNSGSG